MTRGLSGGLEAIVASEIVRPAYLLELRLDSGDVNVWSGTGTLNVLSKNWDGLGAMGSISGPTEASDLSDVVMKATLSHIPIATLPDFVTEFKTNDPVGREFDLHLAFFAADGTLAAGDVITLMTGFIDSASMVDGEEGMVQIDLVSEASRLRRTRVYRLTAQHQEDLFTGDLGLEFQTDLDAEVLWGAATPKEIVSVGGGGGSGVPGERFGDPRDVRVR